ncbi:MAG: TlpA family protein disulfide reductase [Gracilimonas sp.]|uniref:TlpA family protein disulfide reductase n=1 Tax=Gracilimonas sp. TaxID=1974203 RepID=UPI0019C660A5|nr:TlpA disulfide reductase family protein [Gracilimonas sp.]MBD3617404.1 TlpA family protein disulfide reductase [Gracilimonas sp.]
MKNLFILFSVIFLLISCTEEKTGPPFKVELPLTENTGQVPPILALTMGGNYVFDPQYPGEPSELPNGMEEGEVIHGILDLEQYVVQGYAEGFIDSSIYQRNMMLIEEETVTEEWVDVIFTVVVGEDQNGDMMVFVEDENGEFDEENPVYFEPSTVEFQDNVFEVMEASVTARMEYFNGKEIVGYEGPASLLYLSDTKPSGSLQLYFNHLRMGSWTVNDQTFDVALIKESAPPYRIEPYTYFYIDLDEDGQFDIMDDGFEAYPVTEPFNIAGESWEISEIAADGSSITIVDSEEEVDPKVALRPGTEAPNFTAETLSGTKLTLSDLRGKYVMIDFWGTWCAPCIEALPVIKEAYDTYAGENFEIVGIANEPSMERFEDFVGREDLDWPQIPEIYEENNEIQELYSVNSYPTYYLVNPDGEIVEYGMALSADNLIETLAKYLE